MVTSPGADLEFLFPVSQIAEASSWEDAAAVVERHPELSAARVLESLLSAGAQALQSGQRDLGAALLEARFLLDLTAEDGVSGALAMLRERGTPKRTASPQTVVSLCATALMPIRDRAAELSLAVLRGAASGVSAVLEAADAWLRLLEHPGFSRVPDDLATGAYRSATPVVWLAWAAAPDQARLDSLVRCHRSAADRAPKRSPERGDQMALLGRALHARHWVGGRLDDLDEAIAAYGAALELIVAEPAEPDLIAPRDRVNTLHEAANAMRDRYQVRGSPDDLDAAIALHGEALGLVTGDDDRLRLILNEIGNDRRLRYQRGGDRADLEEAIATHERVLHLSRGDEGPVSAVLNNLGNELRDRYEVGGEISDLDRAVDLHRRAIALAGEEVPWSLSDGLANDLLARYEQNGNDSDRIDALALLRRALARIAEQDPDRPVAVMDVGVALMQAYRLTGSGEELTEAIDCFREAVDSSQRAAPVLSKRMANLGGALRVRYQRSGDDEDLDQAVASLRQAVELQTDADGRGSTLANLGVALSDRYDRYARLPDLEAALRALEQARDLIPTSSHERAWVDGILGLSLHRSYGRTGRLDDLNRAVSATRAAVEATNSLMTDQPVLLNGLGLALLARYRITARSADLDEAVERLTEAAERVAYQERAGILTTLGALLLTRTTSGAARPDDADHGIRLLRQAVDVTPRDSPHRPRRLGALGAALLDSSNPADLDEAVQVLRQAVAESPQAAFAATLLNNLGAAYKARFDRQGDPADRDAATRMVRRCCAIALDTDVEVAAGTARWWGDWAAERCDWSEASEAYTLAVEAVERAFRFQLLRVQKEFRLRRSGDVSVLAAHAAATADDPKVAVMMLERGRALLLSESLELGQSDLSALSRGRPELAASYEGAVGDWLKVSRQTLERDELIMAL
jgi:tetratricopeptide (TPR) repeat protein